MSEIKLLIIDNVADTQIVRIRKHDFTEQSGAIVPLVALYVFCDYAPLVLVTWQSHKPPTGAGTKCECGQNYGLYQDIGHRLTARAH